MLGFLDNSDDSSDGSNLGCVMDLPWTWKFVNFMVKAAQLLLVNNAMLIYVTPITYLEARFVQDKIKIYQSTSFWQILLKIC